MARAILRQGDWLLLRGVAEIEFLGRLLDFDQIILHLAIGCGAARFQAALAAEPKSGKALANRGSRWHGEAQSIYAWHDRLAYENLFAVIVPITIDIKIDPCVQ